MGVCLRITGKGCSVIMSRNVFTTIIVIFLALSMLPLNASSESEYSGPFTQITISHPSNNYYDSNQSIYDIAGNESRQENISISAIASNLDEANSYRTYIAVYEEYKIYGENADRRLVSTTFASTSISFNFSGLGGQEMENNTNYTILVKLQEKQAWNDYYDIIFNATFNFTVNAIPEPEPGPEPEPEPEPVSLQNLGFECDLGDDGVWDMILDDLPDYSSTLGMIGCTFSNPNPVSTRFNFSFTYFPILTGAGFDITGITSFSNEIMKNSTKEFNFSLDCGSPSNCEETNGTITIEVDIFSENDFQNWTGNDSTYIVEYTIANNSTITPILIRGCMDENATNFKPNATEDDGSCIFPEPEPKPPLCPLCNLEYYIPNDISISTPFNLNVNVTSSDGWDYYGGASISWGINGNILNGTEIDYELTNVPSSGTTNIILCIEFDNGPEECISETANVNQQLNGYISQSSQLESIIYQNGGQIHFYAMVFGGLAPYSYEWEINNEETSNISSFIHDFPAGEYNLSLIITDARGDKKTYEDNVIIIDLEIDEEEIITSEKEEVIENELEPFSVVVAGGGTLLLVMLTRRNSKNQRKKILNRALNEIRDGNQTDNDELWDFGGQ